MGRGRSRLLGSATAAKFAGRSGRWAIRGHRWMRQAGRRMWNLYYRLAPAAWGHRFATEIVKAARSAAATVDPQLPVVAYLLEHNAGSTKIAERAGLTLGWRVRTLATPTARLYAYCVKSLRAGDALCSSVRRGCCVGGRGRTETRKELWWSCRITASRFVIVVESQTRPHPHPGGTSR